MNRRLGTIDKYAVLETAQKLQKLFRVQLEEKVEDPSRKLGKVLLKAFCYHGTSPLVSTVFVTKITDINADNLLFAVQHACMLLLVEKKAFQFFGDL